MKPSRIVAGFTLLEMLLAGGLLALTLAVAVPFFQSAFSSLTSMEAQNALKTGAHKALDRIQLFLTENKRFFPVEDPGLEFLPYVQFGSGVPAPLADSRLPAINQDGSLTPSSGTFSAADVGNSLFFVSLDAPEDVVDPGIAGARPLRVDIYHFNYYFLAADGSGSIGGKPKLQLWEWHSVKYVDLPTIQKLAGDPASLTNLVIALYGRGYLYAYNPSLLNPLDAIYGLESDGTLTAAPSMPIFEIPQASAGNMMNLATGALGGSYRYGVSPNTIDKQGTFDSPVSVPRFAAVSASSPTFSSGFEVAVVGDSGARQVLMRLVLVAQGSFPSNVTHERIAISTIRDIW